MDTKLIKIAFSALIVAVLVGCGGGGGGGSDPVAITPPEEGFGIDRLGVNVGTVTGFGSIFVNGIEFETDSAEFDIDDDSISSSQDDLEIGDTVRVTFDPDLGTNIAQTVFSDDAVEGPIDSIDVAANRLVVVGQLVLVDATTSFDNSIPTASLSGLNVGDFVEVNGLVDSDAAIRATRIELGGGEVEVHGPVSALDTTALTFSINDLVVDYGAVPAIIDDDFASGTFANGDLVEVKGVDFSPAGALLATKVEPDGLGLAAGGDLNLEDFDEVEVEIEGFITRFTSASDFAVAGFPVITNAGTQFEGGSAADLALNVKVEVEGELDSTGTLVAEEVDIRQTNDLRVTALVDSVDAAANTLILLGISVRVDTLTRIEDKSDAEIEPFSLFDLNVDDYIEVRGSADPSGGSLIIAGLLEREDTPDVPGEETSLRGFVESVGQSVFTIAGVTIETNSQTVFRDSDDTPIDASTFFGGLQADDLVDAEGTETGQMTILADEVELED